MPIRETWDLHGPTCRAYHERGKKYSDPVAKRSLQAYLHAGDVHEGAAGSLSVFPPHGHHAQGRYHSLRSLMVISLMKVYSASGSGLCLCVTAVVEVRGSRDGGGFVEAAIVFGVFRAHPARRVEAAGGGVVERGQEAGLAHAAYAWQLANVVGTTRTERRAQRVTARS